MKKLVVLISALGFAATALPCLLFFYGLIDHEAMNTVTLVGTIVWFVATPLWMGRAPANAETPESI
jgi:hypothetical protein